MFSKIERVKGSKISLGVLLVLVLLDCVVVLSCCGRLVPGFVVKQ